MKKSFLLLLLLFSLKIHAQTNLEEVVYLKNGSIIRGTIIEQIPNEQIKIQTKDGNVFVYKYEEILKLTKEPSLGISQNAYKSKNEGLDNDLRKHKAKGIGLLTTGSVCFGVGFPFLVIGPLSGSFGALLSGTFLTAASIPMLAVGGIQIKKYKDGTQGNVSFSPHIGIHEQVGINFKDKSKGMSVGASVKFTF